MGTPSVQPHRRIDAKLVGLVALNSEIVQDQVDQLPALVLLHAALAQQVLADSGRGASASPTTAFSSTTAAATSPGWSGH